MDTTPTTPPLTGLRWTVVFATLGICVALITILTRASLASPFIETLGLLALTLVVYGWMLLPITVSMVTSVIVGVTLAWAWALDGRGVLGWQLLLFVLLVSVAGWERRRRAGRVLRLQQILEDFAEEQTAKEQAIALTHQNRNALQKKLARYTQLQ